MQCYELIFAFNQQDSKIDYSTYLNALKHKGYFSTPIFSKTPFGFIKLGFKVIYDGCQSEVVNFMTNEISSVIPDIELVSLTSVYSSELICIENP